MQLPIFVVSPGLFPTIAFTITTDGKSQFGPYRIWRTTDCSVMIYACSKFHPNSVLSISDNRCNAPSVGHRYFHICDFPTAPTNHIIYECSVKPTLGLFSDVFCNSHSQKLCLFLNRQLIRIEF